MTAKVTRCTRPYLFIGWICCSFSTHVKIEDFPHNFSIISESKIILEEKDVKDRRLKMIFLSVFTFFSVRKKIIWKSLPNYTTTSFLFFFKYRSIYFHLVLLFFVFFFDGIVFRFAKTNSLFK